MTAMTKRYVQNYVLGLYRRSGKRPVEVYERLPRLNRARVCRWLAGCERTRLTERSIDQIIRAVTDGKERA